MLGSLCDWLAEYLALLREANLVSVRSRHLGTLSGARQRNDRVLLRSACTMCGPAERSKRRQRRSACGAGIWAWGVLGRPVALLLLEAAAFSALTLALTGTAATTPSSAARPPATARGAGTDFSVPTLVPSACGFPACTNKKKLPCVFYPALFKSLQLSVEFN